MRKFMKILSVTFILVGICALVIPDTYNKPETIDNKIVNNLTNGLNGIVETTNNYVNYVEKNNTQKYDELLLIGDSRFVGMEKFNKDNFFKAEVGEGYNFLIESLPVITDRYQRNNCIVIGLGVNDLYNIDKYINSINDLALANNYNVCVITIGPVEEEKYGDTGYAVTNEQINEFNDSLKNKLNKKVILLDINKFLIDDGYNTIDGLHYNDETYEKIYEYINENLKEDN